MRFNVLNHTEVWFNQMRPDTWYLVSPFDTVNLNTFAKVQGYTFRIMYKFQGCTFIIKSKIEDYIALIL